jgi:hypothetical protein
MGKTNRDQIRSYVNNDEEEVVDRAKSKKIKKERKKKRRHLKSRLRDYEFYNENDEDLEAELLEDY